MGGDDPGRDAGLRFPAQRRRRSAAVAAAAATGGDARLRRAVAELEPRPPRGRPGGQPGQPVYAAGAATVVYAGTLAGRQLVSLAHPGGLHTSYEPVRAAVRVGQSVTAGTVIGELVAGHPGCPVAACLHWGAMWGPAARADYVDPLGLLASTPIRLKPLHR